MTAKSAVVLISSCFAALAGGVLAIVLIRAVTFGITFGRITNLWIVAGDLLIGALAFYLFYLGQRGIAYARGIPRPKARFGYGRIILGALVLFGSASEHFHPAPPNTPLAIKTLPPSNPTEAAVMHVTEGVIMLGCGVLMISGMWTGFRRKPAQ